MQLYGHPVLATAQQSGRTRSFLNASKSPGRAQLVRRKLGRLVLLWRYIDCLVVL